MSVSFAPAAGWKTAVTTTSVIEWSSFVLKRSGSFRTVEARGMSAGMARRMTDLASFAPSTSSIAVVAIRSNGVRTELSGTGSRAASGTSLYPTTDSCPPTTSPRL